MIGITKAYCTRVGGGPFPTELHDATGDFLRNAGNEFGSTTGRPRRCGWIDLVALKYTCMINGVTQMVMTKADILDAMDELNVCIGYTVDGRETTTVPFQMQRLPLEPVYRSFKGWNTDISRIQSAAEIPPAMKEYIEFLQQYTGVPFSYVSNGPGRDQVIRL